MVKFLLILGIMSTGFTGLGQELYFPPIEDDTWETKDPSELNWCPEKIDSLYSYLEEKGTRGFVVLHQGKMVLEQYFNEADQDSWWYWASAGKSLAAVLVGCAQEDQLLDISDPTSDHLGEGWTSAPPDKEILITIEDQLSMTTGLDYTVDDLDCLDPECLLYNEDAGDQWFYHNAPYRLVQDVLVNASDMTINQFTADRLGDRIGMGGLWINYVRWGSARDMARFGLLVSADGVWDDDTVLGDLTFIDDMRTSSQDLNESYGYLWWLNGQDSFILPGLTFPIAGSLAPAAPEDMYAALGKDDQKIYIVPSMDLVVVRQGAAAEEILAGPSSFDSQLWEKLLDLECTDNVGEEYLRPSKVYPNPTDDRLYFDDWEQGDIEIINAEGQVIGRFEMRSGQLDVSALPSGIYFARSLRNARWSRFIKR